MAKKALSSTSRYSSGDQCLIALLSEPVKSFKIKPTTTTKIKKSEELLRSIVYSELFFNVVTSSPSTK